MKTQLLAALAVSIVGTTAFAGETYVTQNNKNVVQTEMKLSLYPDHEWTIDAFGTYAFTQSNSELILGDHAFGGGLAANYFFTKNIGLGIEGQAVKNQLGRGDDITGSGAVNVFYRYPIGDTAWAPYAYVGGGAIFNANKDNLKSIVNNNGNDEVLIEGHVGIGVEYRFTRNFGIFTDGRWTVVEDGNNNFASVRTGLRFAF